MMNTRALFKKISFYEIICLFILILLISDVIGVLFGDNDVGFLFFDLFIISFFIFKFRKNKAEFKKDLTSFLTWNNIKKAIFMTLAIFFLTWGVEIIYLYSGITYYLISNNLNLIGPMSFIYPQLQNIDNFPVGVLSFNFPYQLGNLIILLDSIIIMPLAEELLYRGVLHNKLSLKFGVYASIVLTSILYVIFSGRLFGLLLMFFIYSVFISIAYSKTENIATPIFMAIVYNFLDQLKYMSGIYYLNTYVAFGMVILLLAIISLAYLIRYCRQNSGEIRNF